MSNQQASIQKPPWFKALLDRIDPNYNALEKWIEGKGKRQADEFERGLALLLCFCGLNTIHVGGGYEDATKDNRLVKFQNANAPVDVIAWSSDDKSLYLCQCLIGERRIRDKIDDIATFANELDNIILSNNITKPRIYRLVITNLDSEYLLEDVFKKAKEKEVMVLTRKDLLNLMFVLKNDDVITQKSIRSLILGNGLNLKN